METHGRSLLKTISYRLTATAISGGITWLLTHNWEATLGVAFVESFGKLLLYYLHERMWAAIKWGKEPSNLPGDILDKDARSSDNHSR